MKFHWQRRQRQFRLGGATAPAPARAATRQLRANSPMLLLVWMCPRNTASGASPGKRGAAPDTSEKWSASLAANRVTTAKGVGDFRATARVAAQTLIQRPSAKDAHLVANLSMLRP